MSHSSPPFSSAVPMSDNDRAEAVLELSILLFSGDGSPHRSSSAFFLPSKPKPFAVAWIDPAVKRSTKILLSRDSSPKIHLPLSSRAIHDPDATLTIQILSSCFPFRRGGGGARLEGAATLPLSSIPAMAGNTFTLPLARPSGRPGGYVRLAARVLWCLGATPPASSSAECSDWASEVDTWPQEECGRIELCKPRLNATRITEDEDSEPPTLLHSDPSDSAYRSQQIEFCRVEPNAPLFPNDTPPKLRLPHADCGDPLLQTEFRMVEPNAPQIPEENAVNISPFPRLQVLPVAELSDRAPAVATGVPVDTRHIEFSRIGPNVSTLRDDTGREGRAWRSFWVGLASGLLAVVMVGAAGLSEG